jgi:serine/threonine-protein kinase
MVAVLRRALAKDRARRFQTADEFGAALQAATQSSDATVVAATRPFHGVVWDPALLQRVERLFAVHVGPMARRAVARATQDVASPDELYATLARSLPSAADRSAFLRAVGGGRVEPSLTASMPAASSLGGRASLGAPARTQAGAMGLSPAAVTAAQGVLTVFVGPIARVLTRNAAAQATSATDFIERLCAHVPKTEEAASLRRRLRAELG